MYRSAEVRWFIQAELPDDMRHWFESVGTVQLEPQRTDEYLVLPGCTTASVKLREDRFEVKALTEPPVAAAYPYDNGGFRDAWVKWSSNAIDLEGFRRQILRPEDEWISVSKTRRLRLFSLESGEPEEVAPNYGWLSGGCQVELTALRAWFRTQNKSAALPWWSLSFEAFGDADTMRDGLDRVICEIFSEAPPSNFSEGTSFSYPVWLTRLQ